MSTLTHNAGKCLPEKIFILYFCKNNNGFCTFKEDVFKCVLEKMELSAYTKISIRI